MYLNNIILSFLTAFIIALVTSPAGISGAILLMPFQISVLGIRDPSANATNFLYNVIAIPSGVYRYWREGRFLWILSSFMILGYFFGIFSGAIIRTKFLIEFARFKLVVGIVLLFLGISVLRPLKRYAVAKAIVVEKMSIWKVKFRMDRIYEFEPIKVFTASLLIGIIGGIYGVGGGALISPILIGLFRLPPYAIAGANLFGTFISSVFGIFSYSLLGYNPKLDIGLSMGLGGLFGIYIGSRIQKYIPEKIIRIALGFLMIILALKYLF